MKSFTLEDYPYEVFKEENDGKVYFVVSYKDVPEAGAAADTQTEALALAKESLQIVLEDLEKRGEPIPKPTIHSLDEQDVTGRITLRMPKSLHRKLIDRSERDGVSLNTSIIVAITAYLTKMERGKNAVRLGAGQKFAKAKPFVLKDEKDNLADSFGY